MGSESKSQPTPPGSPTGPKYVEFVVFAVLAVVASAAIVVFLIKPANTAPVAEAGPIVSDEEIPDANITVEGDKDEGQLTQSVVARAADEQPGVTVPKPTDTPEANSQDSDTSSARVDDGPADANVAVVPTETAPPIVSPAPKTYSLTATAVDGSVVRSPERASYDHGETVTLTAVPNAGHSFANWSGDLSGSTNPVRLTMEADKNVTAYFTPKTYSLTITAANGSVTMSPEQTSYNHGEAVTLQAVPNAGHQFSNWSGSLSGNTNPTTVVMEADKAVVASFAPKAYNLTAAAVNGSVTRNPDKAGYSHGDTVTLTAVPDSEYRFSNWTGDLSGNTNPVTLVVEADTSVAASFALKTYSLTVTAGDGSVSKSPGPDGYKRGDAVTLQAVPNTGYSFANWSGDLSGTANPATLIIDGDKAVTASFVLTAKASDLITNSVGMNLIYVPAGAFMMGSSHSADQLAEEYDKNRIRFASEFPQHPVQISRGFWMGQTEVTQGQYESIMNARPWSGQAYVQEDANNPAVYVSWDEAMEFCRRLSEQEGKTYRLPTEAEWEYACRAGTQTRFSFGDSDLPLADYAWFDGNADAVRQDYAHAVGLKKPNPWGLYDMHGNVFEWCSDYYDGRYYSSSPAVDPTGPELGTSRCLRGGSWDSAEDCLRSSYRFGSRVNRGLLVGFRVVSDGAAERDIPAVPIQIASATEAPKAEDVGVKAQVKGTDVVGVAQEAKSTEPDVEKVVEAPPSVKGPDQGSDKPTVADTLPAVKSTAPDAVKPAVVEPPSVARDSAANAAIYASGNVHDILSQAPIDARSGNAEQARAALTSLLSNKDTAVMAGYELGLIHYENGDLDKAMPLFKDALSAAFSGPPSGKDEQALRALLSQEADAARIRYELGLICQSQGQHEQAASLFRNALNIVSAKGATFIGVKKCKSCHFKRWNSWRKTKMAQTFEVLKPGVRSAEKTRLKFDPNKDYTKDPTCLGCHASGFGIPGGYVVPADGDTEAKKQAEDNAGITCEGCHGPGSKASVVLEEIKENKRTYTFAELEAVGFHKAGVRSCTHCHNAGDPGKEPGYHFPYEERRKEGQHDNIELKYRQD